MTKNYGGEQLHFGLIEILYCITASLLQL